jgi:hypothetical protein
MIDAIPDRWVKKTHFGKVLIILIFSIFLTGADYLRRDQIPSGSDLRSIRCDGRIVRTGDLMRDVRDRCGDPMRETRMANEPHTVWIYRFGQSNFIHYFAFIHERLQRIFKVSCRGNNPDCQ